MPDLPFDPPHDAPQHETTLGQAIVVTTDNQDKKAPPIDPAQARRYGHRDILVMYPSLRLDHLRYLEKCGLLKPVHVSGTERFYAFADLTALRLIAGELQQGSAFRAVVRKLQSSRTGQLAFDFRLDAHPARIIELKPRNPQALSGAEPGTQGSIPLGTPGTLSTIGTGAFGAISSAEQYFLMGSLLDDGTPDRTEEAVKAYRRALEEDPDLVAALINLANIRYSRDELAEAQALYERAIALDSSYFEAHFNLGNIHHDHAQYASAEASYREALALNGDYADAHFYLAVTLEKMGRSVDARAHWKAYERLAPQGEWVELAKEFWIKALLVSLIAIAFVQGPSDEQLIRAARDRSNAAIARHDLDGIAAEWLDDVHVVASTSAQTAGKEANRQRMAAQFKNRPDTIYVRKPVTIEIFAPWDVASERGEWTGRWTEPDGMLEIAGTYQAQWRRIDGRWRIQGELFVPARCTGSKYCSQRPQ